MASLDDFKNPYNNVKNERYVSDTMNKAEDALYRLTTKRRMDIEQAKLNEDMKAKVDMVNGMITSGVSEKEKSNQRYKNIIKLESTAKRNLTLSYLAGVIFESLVFDEDWKWSHPDLKTKIKNSLKESYDTGLLTEQTLINSKNYFVRNVGTDILEIANYISENSSALNFNPLDEAAYDSIIFDMITEAEESKEDISKIVKKKVVKTIKNEKDIAEKNKDLEHEIDKEDKKAKDEIKDQDEKNKEELKDSEEEDDSDADEEPENDDKGSKVDDDEFDGEDDDNSDEEDDSDKDSDKDDKSDEEFDGEDSDEEDEKDDKKSSKKDDEDEEYDGEDEEENKKAKKESYDPLNFLYNNKVDNRHLEESYDPFNFIPNASAIKAIRENKSLFRTIMENNTIKAQKMLTESVTNEEAKMDIVLSESIIDYTILECLNTARIIELNSDEMKVIKGKLNI